MQDAGSTVSADPKMEVQTPTDGNTTVATTPLPLPEPPTCPPPRPAKPPRECSVQPHWMREDKFKRQPHLVEAVRPPPKVVLRAVSRLGLSKGLLEKAKIASLEQLGRYLDKHRIARIGLSLALTDHERAVAMQDWVDGLLASQDPNITTDHKLMALQCAPVILESKRKIRDQMVDMAERAADKASEDKPRNLPPSVAVQVNLDGLRPSLSQPRQSASSGTPDSDKDSKDSG